MTTTPTQGVFMKHLISTKSIAAVAFALGTFTAASSVYAGSDMHMTIGVSTPGIHAQLIPVQMQSRPVFTPEQSHFSRFNDGRRDDGDHWQRRNPYSGHDRNGIASSGDPRNRWHQTRSYGPYGDLDRDGIMNRWDSDRDGDGIRNRFDRRPDIQNRR